MQGLRDLHFIHAAWLWLLLLIPLMWGLYGWQRQQRGSGQWEQLIDPALRPFVLQGKAGKLSWIALALMSVTLAIAVLAMAGPSWEKQEIPVFRNQQALVIAMDFSASMQAEDAKPDRLTLARFKLLDLFKARPDGQTGLVVFAGDAFVVSPLTDDVETIQEQIKNLSPALMPASGSHVAPAIPTLLCKRQHKPSKRGITFRYWRLVRQMAHPFHNAMVVLCRIVMGKPWLQKWILPR